MKKIPFSVLTILCIIVTASGQDVTSLKEGKLLESSISSKDSHRYSIPVKNEYQCYLIVEQMGIDLRIVVKDPMDKDIGTYDSPNGRQGPEPVVFTAEKSGNYIVEVLPFDNEEPPGKYTIQLLRMEPVAKTLEGQVDQLFIPWNNPNVPGASIAVAKEGKVLYSKGYGVANMEYDIPNSPTTVFHIASVSKQFTAFAVTMLADQGKLSLDDDVRKYIPEVPDFGETITLKQLIHHTSGLRDQWNLLAMAGWRLDDVITRDQILRLVSHQKELNFKPGAEYVYCNTGYTLLAETVSRVTGQTFAAWTKENIFDPLGMSNTLFYDDHEKIVKNRAYSYSTTWGGYKKSVLSYANVGATSLFTTVEDLSKWAWNFNDIKVGNEKIMAQMEERGILNNGDTISYAFGQVAGNYKGLTTRRHGGADAGYRTHFLRFPDQGMSFVVFSNLGSFNTGGKANEMADIYLKDLLEEPEEEKVEKSEESNEETSIAVAEEILKEYCGRYELQPGFIITVTHEGGKFIAQATGQPNVDLIAQSETEFLVPEGPATIIFQRNEAGKVNTLLLKQGGQEMIAPLMPPFDPAGVDLEEFTGRYYSEELQTIYEFVVKKDTLVAQHQRHDPIKLTITKKDAFSGNIWFFGQAEFDRNDSGVIVGCRVSSGRVRNVKFEKMD